MASVSHKHWDTAFGERPEIRAWISDCTCQRLPKFSHTLRLDFLKLSSSWICCKKGPPPEQKMDFSCKLTEVYTEIKTHAVRLQLGRSAENPTLFTSSRFLPDWGAGTVNDRAALTKETWVTFPPPTLIHRLLKYVLGLSVRLFTWYWECEDE